NGLAYGATDKRLGGCHHADVGLGREEALAEPAALVGAVEDGVVFRLEVRRRLDGHGAADVGVGLGDLFAAEAQRGEQVEAGGVELLLGEAEAVAAEVGAEGPLVEGERQLEDAGELALDAAEGVVGEAAGAEAGRVDVRAALERGGAAAGADDVLDLARR